MKYLSIDYGDAHIGVAIGDDQMRLALPIETFENKGIDDVCARIDAVCAQESVDSIVIGVPRTGGIFVDQRKKIEDVIEYLKKKLPFPIIAADESFTSKEATRLMRDMSPSAAHDEHAVAAMLILQGFLDNS